MKSTLSVDKKFGKRITKFIFSDVPLLIESVQGFVIVKRKALFHSQF